MIFGSEGERRFAAALLVAPAALPHIGYLFAQPDVTLYILVLPCLALLLRATPEIAALVTCPLCCLGLLAHEAFCLMFYPLIAAVLLHPCVRRRLRWIAAVAHVLVVSAVFAAILHWGKLKVSPDVLLAEAQSRTNVGVQRQVYDVMASTLAQQRERVHLMYSADVMRVLGITLVLSAPYFVLLTRLLHGAMRTAGYRPLQIATTQALFLSPLLLCTLGHDTTRWIGAMCLDATLFVLYLYLADTRDGCVRRYFAGLGARPILRAVADVSDRGRAVWSDWPAHRQRTLPGVEWAVDQIGRDLSSDRTGSLRPLKIRVQQACATHPFAGAQGDSSRWARKYVCPTRRG